MGRNYQELPGFENVLLEDSYVLRIVEEPARLVFELELVLLPGHPRYEPPAPGEAHCYRAAELEFAGIEEASWGKRRFRPFTDARGDVDLGNIDALLETAPGRYHLEGDWGAVDVRSGAPVLRIR